MANTARKNVSKKPKEPVLQDEKLLRHERLTLILYLLAGLALIAGMVVLSMFLSSGSAPFKVWLPAAILGGLCAVGFLTTYLMRRAGDK